MGVEIYGYVTKRAVACDVPARMWCDHDDHSCLYNVACFVHRAGIEPLFVGDDVARYGCYELGQSRQIMRLPYSAYNRWRERLCRAVNDCMPERLWDRHDDDDEAVETVPFYELIHFADNEGTLGGGTLRRLLRDFEAHGEKLKAAGVERVDEWTQVLREVVAGDGVMVFS